MKNLKSYKLFESQDVIKNNIQDMLVDLTDSGIEVKINHGSGNKGVYIFLISFGEVNSNQEINIVPSEWKDELLRILSYLESEEFKFSSYTYKYRRSYWRTSKPGTKMSEIFNLDETQFLQIIFTN